MCREELVVSKKTEKASKGENSKVWLWMVVIAAVVPWLGNVVIGVIYRSYSQEMPDTEINNQLSQMSGILTLVSLVALVLMITALFRLKGKLKLIAIAGIASTLFVGYLAFFSYTWLTSSPF